jgi:hypothetical protein
VNGDLTPAVIAAGGGTAMFAGIAALEHKRYSQMRRSRVRRKLRFPISLDPLRAFATLDALSGLPHTNELIVETYASEGTIEHYLWAPAAIRRSVESTLTGVIGSLRITEADSTPDDPATLSLRLFVPTPSVLASDGAIEASRALLSGIAALRTGEQVVVRWALSPGAAWSRRESDHPDRRTKEIERAWRRKTANPGFSVAGLALVRAGTVGRARELASHVESVVRSRRGAVGELRITTGRGNRRLSSLPRTTRTSGWLSTAELLPLFGWPLGSELVVPGVEVGAARQLPVPRGVPREGRRLFIGRDAYGERSVALSTEAAKHHLLVAGTSGSGKSTLIARAALSDIEGGFAGAVIDPKADLVAAILDRVKPEHASRIVVLDPGDRSRPTPGLAMFKGGDPDVRADVLTGALRSAFPADAWGVRTDFYLRLAIRSLSEISGATLAEIGRLFFDERFLQHALTKLSDPFLVAAWQGYLNLSSAARAEHVQAPMNRIMALLSRPQIRGLLASPGATLDISRLFAERKFLLASLAPGALGESGAAVAGSALMYVIWSAIEARVSVAPERRHPIFLYLDELATLTNGTPFGFELLAERARGLGAGLTVAVQTLGRIPEPARSALVGNTASFVTYRANADEARGVARHLPGLSEADVAGLGRYEVAARIGTGAGASVAVVTGRTEPLGPETGVAEAIRDVSAARYGTSLDSPELVAEPPVVGSQDAPLGRAGRDS